MLAEFNVILKAWLGVVGAILFLLFAFKVAHQHSRAVLLTWFLVTPLFISLLHGLARIGLRFMRARGLNQRTAKKIHEILNSCRTLGAKVFLVPDLYAFRFFNTRLLSLGDVLVLDFNPDSNAKRMFDIVFSLVVLLVTLPLTLLIAFLIKCQDGGPVFYGHRRITSAGKRFFCLKFRTMHVNADRKLKEILKNDPEARQEWEKTFKLKNDPRITWIGRFLRKTSLDELPQFLNVLKGEMSVVGARPIVQEDLTCYYRENGGIYCSIKPGITGPWQVSKRSDTEDYEERVALDTWYALNRTFLLDLKIIFKTVGCMVKGKGAY